MPRTFRPLVASVAACLIALTGASCDSKPKAKVKPADLAAIRDVPQPLRGTVGAEAAFRGIEPVLVSGFGIVVGLNGTGGGELPVPIQNTMERQVSLGGIGKGGAGSIGEMGPMTPQEFLRRDDVAVVIVEARVPPGAPEGAKFDLSVRALPGSSVTSLEGGTLWSTELRIGPATVFGGMKSHLLGEGKGPVAINPFSEPSVGPSGELTITRTRGRVLNGGVVTNPLLIEMVLDNDSPSRARAVVQAINSKFPREPGDDGAIARGRGAGGESKAYQSIAIRVPQSYKTNPYEFLQLVRYMRIDQAFLQEYARQDVEGMKASPGMADDYRWLLQSIGKPALPFMVPMYEYPEYGPRMAALTAGARLGDARTVGPLIELANDGTGSLQTDAIMLLGDMPRNPSINMALRVMLGSPDLDIRVAAYDALVKRDDPSIVRVPVGRERGSGIPKFTLDLVPIPSGAEPMIYVTQQGEPRVVLFGGIDQSGARPRPGAVSGEIQFTKPFLVTAWGERFMIASDTPGAAIRVRYVDPRTDYPLASAKAPEGLAEMIEFMAHKTTPEEPKPGLNFTYSEVAGALYEMSRQNALNAAFATEGDKLRAEIFEASQATLLADRPEATADEAPDSAIFKPTAPAPLPSAEAQTTAKKSRVIPLNKPKTTLKKGS